MQIFVIEQYYFLIGSIATLSIFAAELNLEVKRFINDERYFGSIGKCVLGDYFIHALLTEYHTVLYRNRFAAVKLIHNRFHVFVRP